MSVEANAKTPYQPAHPLSGKSASQPKLVRVNPSVEKTRDREKAEHEKIQLRIMRLEQLLTFESQIRAVGSLKELQFCVVNEALQFLNATQIFFVERKFRLRDRVRIGAVSHVSMVDPNSTSVVALEDVFREELSRSLAEASEGEITPQPFYLPMGIAADAEVEAAAEHPNNSVLVPLFDAQDKPVGCLVFFSEDGAICAELPIVKRVAEAVQYAWQGFLPSRKMPTRIGLKKLVGLSLMLLVLAALFVRIPLSALAPVEIVASEPVVVAAPINGVVREVLVDANVEVEKGTPLFQYEDTVLLSELKIAEQAWSVANAKLKRAQQSSFGEGTGKRDLAIAQAELDLALSQLEFAKAKFSKTTVKAPQKGVVILDRKSDWQGKPVSVGQKVMEIAQVANVEARIDLAVSDAIVLQKDAKAQLYLDTNPLNALDAVVFSASYRASLDAANDLSFPVSAKLKEGTNYTPRIGSRGTAQIYGEDVSLGFYVFRRPLAAVRQWVGW